ncbi:MAG: 23S rRNA (guanosine(2251)-2'-O)-methyltransferase RlmB [Bacteroidales bacterium]|nr:23S rRNA (guanosine(2251)-2'-O)-methyltransferase RlmB [Bacteroidales bacterium]MDD6622434.1 23S rRNA (guanosine(2251)-2'-O)-methyltransferase RlmB [Bacteroidales bacterium]MDD6669564.1 23S rRNA (guanosine(2251)-2'-O)-methyltransferase RlmB [Bacteroidales bacterium]
MLHSDEYIFGMRAVIEALNGGREIDRILVKKDLTGELAGELFEAIRSRSVYSQRVPIEKLNRITRKNHQGVIAILSPVSYANLDNLVPEIFESGRVPFIVVLDGITDVRNFGAIARTCECAGVDAIVIPERNSVSINADAVKTSAGALLHIPVARVKNLTSALRMLKASGLTVVGVTEKAVDDYTKVDLSVPTALVMGAEDTGIASDNIRECDALAAIPMFGKINSLNVSVAAGIVVYEVVRQRSANA